MSRKIPNGYLSVPDYANRIGVSPPSVQKWIKSGRLDAIPGESVNQYGSYLVHKDAKLRPITDIPEGYISLPEWIKEHPQYKQRIYEWIRQGIVPIWQAKGRKPSNFIHQGWEPILSHTIPAYSRNTANTILRNFQYS